MVMLVMPGEGEAIRLGSRQTEVGGATSAMSGMGAEKGSKGWRGKGFAWPGSRIVGRFNLTLSH